MRHAHAHQVKVDLALVDQALHLTVTDDGSGYDVKKACLRASQGNSLGRVGMAGFTFLDVKSVAFYI